MTSAFVQLHPGEVTIHAPQQFYVGDTWEITALCTDGDGNPLDLSAAAITWKLKSVADNSIKLTLTVGSGIALIENTSGDLVLGQCIITVTPAQSAPLAPGYYRDELTAVVGNKTLTQFKGRIEAIEKL
jgi:hypothetical protein